MGKKVVDITAELVKPILEQLDLELYDVEFKKEGKDWFLRVFIDSETGVDLEDCGKVSERLSEKLDETDPIEQAYFLEVSSPGAERPLKREKDLLRSIGKNVHVTLYEPIDGEKALEGELTEFDGETLTIEIKIKTRKKTVTIPYAKVASARLAVVF
ncbi:ribosome maturation factor RimP [Halalkalibacterium halodurans]|jgi:ribosome maturation factor RimP|uniref:Ribosome maturation factor RimP n=2 Tax=Halalkalibacterium halodurans TaxID=86665 RepID=RIMP_HALH5|nr:ribosome maturation factor RimP [Halalkalibacterium halodurans]Q9KA73.1 RecName: Full=Ribosome maturation factor RimP [Halalkalibacterium halodurans C-125]MDY7222965.1 ribosome maturation factor RimP [Halalkalibacterium halodurans]MDY7242186.1 ribosome maturation factor RimP [Halalkalibacterium halodurans]MED3646206.1 ribosome maturation factor RimP [Halalkalibacterium halodurans]MED4080082.1 ribosome maturation factor RimP [Halalkalibacterium halodurans]MED4086849.1 ribosome maturation fa